MMAMTDNNPVTSNKVLPPKSSPAGEGTRGKRPDTKTSTSKALYPGAPRAKAAAHWTTANAPHRKAVAAAKSATEASMATPETAATVTASTTSSAYQGECAILVWNWLPVQGRRGGG
jgi:hypothetical protein